MSWIDPRKYLGNQQTSPADRLSEREWVRLYRSLGIPADSSREQVQKATARLRRKYASNEAAIERVESANLWIMTKMMQRKEEELQKRQAANRLREIGNSPKRLLQKYVFGYFPPSIRQMFEAPDTKHFRTTSGLLGVFALLGLCVPTQATNFVGLGAASSLGLIYQRNRPEPVKDDMGNVGRVQQLNYKEMGASIACVAIGVAVGTVLSIGLSYVVDTPFPAIFCLTTCSVLWSIALFLKVYQCFDETEA